MFFSFSLFLDETCPGASVAKTHPRLAKAFLNQKVKIFILGTRLSYRIIACIERMLDPGPFTEAKLKPFGVCGHKHVTQGRCEHCVHFPHH